jgi:hypothetical protein
MKEVYTHHDLARLGYFKTVLDEAGIANLIRHESLYNLAVPFAVMPSLCCPKSSEGFPSMSKSR